MVGIGGFFGLELNKNGHYHSNSIMLNSGKNALEYILRVKKYSKVYIPYFTCEVILLPLRELNIKFEFYHINENFELIDFPSKLAKDEAILYTNYFGLKEDYIIDLYKIFGSQLIVDNTQSFYSLPISGVDTFYSARKFFGVPDGAYLYTNSVLDMDIPKDKSYQRMAHLLKRIDLGSESAYDDFKKNDEILSQQPMMYMSDLTNRILMNIDYKNVRVRRIANYRLLDDNLFSYNCLRIKLPDDCVPMIYPFLYKNGNLRKYLIEKKIYIATYWPNVLKWCNENSQEYLFASNLIPLPIDQRYGYEELAYIIKVIKEYDTERK